MAVMGEQSGSKQMQQMESDMMTMSVMNEKREMMMNKGE
jgi:hypothetical protein